MRGVSRRAALGGAGAAALLPLGGMARLRPGSLGNLEERAPICHVAHDAPAAGLRPLRLAWNANALWTVGVPVADCTGIFERHGLAVELVNFGGSTHPLLEAISTGKADAGVGMARANTSTAPAACWACAAV